MKDFVVTELKLIVARWVVEKRMFKMNEQREFIKKVMKFLGVDMFFLRLGMRVQFQGDFGTIVGFNGRNTLLVEFDNKSRWGDKPLPIFPYNYLRYFTENGILIKETS